MKNEHEMSLEEALQDTDRVEYFDGYANAMLQAVTEDGVSVKGYFGWSEHRLCWLFCGYMVDSPLRFARQF